MNLSKCKIKDNLEDSVYESLYQVILITSPEQVLNHFDRWLSTDKIVEILSDYAGSYDLPFPEGYDSFVEYAKDYQLSVDSLLDEVTKWLSTDTLKEAIEDYCKDLDIEL